MQVRAGRAQERRLEKELVGQVEKALTFLETNKGAGRDTEAQRVSPSSRCLGLSRLWVEG